MNKSISIIALIIILMGLGIFIGYLMDNNGHLNENDVKNLGINPENRTNLTLYTNRPTTLNQVIVEIKDKNYYNGYDNDTIKWMESLKDKKAFISNSSYVVMDKNDASKINSTYITDIATTDTYNEYYIDCVIVENRSIGGKRPMNIVVVKDVKYIGNHTFYYEV